MSDDDESPTSYSKPNTPEIDKLTSLMVSSPSTNSRTPPKDDSFYEKLQEYYELKQEYDQKLRETLIGSGTMQNLQCH